jgi:nucleoside-diphosphate-sugar epimerase
MKLPNLLVTGSSGFIGRHLLDSLKHETKIIGIARRSQTVSGAPVHPNIHWIQADIAERRVMRAAERQIRDLGGVDACIHLAAHYDFTGIEDPEYRRTNVDGMRHVLELCRKLRVRHFVFSSSLAACQFHRPVRLANETTPADGDHIYAVTKALGEAMLDDYRDDFPSTVVRFAALFSDWCEYPPLFIFLKTWLSSAWHRGILGGHGRFASPFLHVRDAVSFLRAILERADHLGRKDILLAAGDGAVTHRELFEESTSYFSGQTGRTVYMPRLLCWLGAHLQLMQGKLAGEVPFQRPWMTRYIDHGLAVDSRRTREVLGWEPRERLGILRRLPFLIENFRTDPVEWSRRNHAAMKTARVARNLRISRILERNQRPILARVVAQMMESEERQRFASYQALSREELEWSSRVALRHLTNAIRTMDRSLFLSYCRDIAEHRFSLGFEPAEVCNALQTMHDNCLQVLREEWEGDGLSLDGNNPVTSTVRFGCDQVADVFEQLAEMRSRGIRADSPSRPAIRP